MSICCVSFPTSPLELLYLYLLDNVKCEPRSHHSNCFTAILFNLTFNFYQLGYTQSFNLLFTSNMRSSFVRLRLYTKRQVIGVDDKILAAFFNQGLRRLLF